MPAERSYRDFDWWLLAVSLILCAIGVLQIYSATLDTKWRDAWWKQIIWIGISLVCMWLVMQIDYHTLLGQVPVLYTVCMALLLLTFALGSYVFGTRRWHTAVRTVQPCARCGRARPEGGPEGVEGLPRKIAAGGPHLRLETLPHFVA